MDKKLLYIGFVVLFILGATLPLMRKPSTEDVCDGWKMFIKPKTESGHAWWFYFSKDGKKTVWLNMPQICPEKVIWLWKDMNHKKVSIGSEVSNG